MKKIVRKTCDPKLGESLKKYIPDSKVVMGRAKRGIFAGRHIQFGNSVSEDGGNKSVPLILLLFQLVSRVLFFLCVFQFSLCLTVDGTENLEKPHSGFCL